jgi:hypothetical protein
MCDKIDIEQKKTKICFLNNFKEIENIPKIYRFRRGKVANFMKKYDVEKSELINKFPPEKKIKPQG